MRSTSMRETSLSLFIATGLALGAGVLVGCQTTTTINQREATGAPGALDARFAKAAESLLMRGLERSPEASIYAGRYENAASLTIPDAARRADDLAFAKAGLAELARFDPAQLSPAERIDHMLLKNRYEAGIWDQESFRDWAWNPSRYNIAGPIGLLLNTPYADEDERLR